MEIPTLPTDNLYKFGTLGGLFMMVAALVVMFQAVEIAEGIGQERPGIVGKIDRAGLERLKQEQDVRQRKLELAFARLRSASEAERAVAIEEIESLLAEADEAQLELKKLSYSLDQVNLEGETLMRRWRRPEIMAKAGLVYVVMGGLWMSISVVEWYRRHQRYQDALVRLALEKAQLEVDELRRRPKGGKPSKAT